MASEDGVVGPISCRKGAVESQDGTGVVGSLHPCTEGHHPMQGFFLH